MIDCHVHTKRSHHGKGDLEDFVEVAIDLKLKVLGFIEHAPLPFDKEHRLTDAEVKTFLHDVKRIKEKHEREITILGGLEVDYIPSQKEYIKKLLNDFSPDYFFGAIHFIETRAGVISVWDYEALQDSRIWKQYFNQLKEATENMLFDSIVHPDLILRSGLNIESALPYFNEQINTSIKCGNIGYEINCSGLTKSSYDPENKIMIENSRSFPNFEVIEYGIKQGIPFTIGSDAHTPDQLYKNIDEVIKELKKRELTQVIYFKNRKKVLINL